MNRYTEDLVRREAQLEEMRRDEQDDQNFMFGLLVVMAAVAGATFTLFVVALAVLMMFLGTFSLQPQPSARDVPAATQALAVAPTATPPAAAATALPAPTGLPDGSGPVPLATAPPPAPAATPVVVAPPAPQPGLPPDTPTTAALPPVVPGADPGAPPVDVPTSAPAPVVPTVPLLPTAAPLVDPLAATPALPPAQPQATPAVPFNSGGLGLSRPEWETIYGSPIEPGVNRYGDPGVYTQDVTYVDELVKAITWQVTQPVIAEVALDVGNGYVPSDGQYVESYAPEGRPDTNVDVYTSPSLAARLGADNKWWAGSTAGTYTVQFTRTPTGIYSVSVSTGNTP